MKHAREASAGTLTVRVRLFARYAELLGRDTFIFEVPHPATVGDAVGLLRSRIHNGYLLPERPMVALNLEHVHADRPLSDGDELALLPPVAGG